MAFASDNFNRANGALGANWTSTSGVFTTSTLAISSNQVASGASVAASFWSASSFSSNQFSQATTITTNGSAGLTLRAKLDGTDNYYFFDQGGGGLIQIQKVVAGTSIGLGTFSRTVSAGDVLRFEAIGATLRGYVNGSLLLEVSDATFSTGAPGILSYATTGLVDNWSGGDINSSVTLIEALQQPMSVISGI